MKRFDMRRLLGRYKESLYAISYEEILVPPGDWEVVETKTYFDGVITNITEDILIADIGGKFTQRSKLLYCYEDLELGSNVYRGDYEYSIIELNEFDSRDTGLRRYIIKGTDNKSKADEDDEINEDNWLDW